MSCNLVEKNGKIINVLDDLGNPSKLYKDAVDKFGEEKGLEMYLVSKSSSFLDFFAPKNQEGISVGEYLENNQLPSIEETLSLIEDEESRQGGTLITDEFEQGRFETREQALEYAKEINSILDSFYSMQEIPVYRAVKADEVDLDPYGIGESWSFEINGAKQFGSYNGSNRIISGFVPRGNVDWEQAIRNYISFSDISDGDSEFELPISPNNRINNVIVENIKSAKERVKQTEPTLQEVTNYVASNNRTEAELNQNQKADLINVLISNPDFKAEDFYDEFGMFIIPKKQYSRYELLTLENEEQIKAAVDALLNTDFTPNVESEARAVEQINEKNAFGKLVNLNPNISEKEKLKEQVLNGEREDYKKADVLIETLDGELISAKNTETEQILPLVVKETFKTDLVSSLETFSLSTLKQGEEQTRIVLKAIENDLISQGIDAIGLSEKPIDEELVDFLNTTKTFINSPTKENTKTFAEKSDIYFERDLEPKVDVVKSDKTDRNYVKLNTNLTEEQLYEKKGLIQSELGKGIYIQTAKESIEDLYNNLRTYTEKYPKGTTLEQYVQEQITEINYDNAENAEAIVLYKMYFDVEDNANKIEQLEIINRSNPAPNTYNTWIRSVKDIKTAKEVFEVAFKEGNMYPDFTIEDMKKALSSGIVTVYSSKNIENGVFITPSRINAIDYAGGEEKNLQKKTIGLYDIAWIDESEGQYAPTTTKRPQYNNAIRSVQKQFTGNYNYLTEDYISDFYIEQLKEKQKNSSKYRNFYKNFEVNEKGINLLNTDDITMQQIEIYADDNLRQYSLISKQMSDLKVDDINENQRDLTVNNPQTLEDYKKDLFRVNDNTIILKDNIETFVKVNGEIYENVETDSNLSVFAKIETPTSDYYQYNIKQPKTNIKLSDYNYLATQEELFTSPKKYLKQEEKNQIKNDKFNC